MCVRAAPTTPASRTDPDPIRWTGELRCLSRSSFFCFRENRRVWARWETASLAVFHGVHTLFARAPFVRRRTDLPDRRVAAPLVIEHFDVGEQLPLGFATAVEAIGELRLDGREATFHHRVVVAVAAPAHAAHDAARLEDVLIVLARVRRALVGVMEEAGLGAPARERRL